MEKLAGLQHLVNAPKLSVVDKIINLIFERRATGFSEEEEAQISKILGGLSPEDTTSLLVAIRLLIKIALRKNVELAQIPQAFPESVDKRLHPIILKILAAHIDTWRQSIAHDKAAAAAPAHTEEPLAAAAAAPAPVVQQQPEEAEKPQGKKKKLPKPQQQEEEESTSAATLPPPPPPPQSAAQEEEKERKEEKKKATLPPPPPAAVSLPPVPSAKEDEEDAERARRIALKKKKKAAMLAQQQQQQQQKQQLQQQLSGPSLPRLQGFDWRVDVRSASDSVARMAVPSVIVQMDVQKQRMGKPTEDDNNGEQQQQQQQNRVVTFELNRETLETMLDGLIFVRDQLASIAAK